MTRMMAPHITPNDAQQQLAELNHTVSQQDSTQFPTFFGLSFQSPDGGETRLHLVQNPSSIGVLCLDVITPATSRTQPARSHPEETPATWPTTAATARTTASSSERPPPPTTPLAPPRPVATHR